jgi:hypothetical protein
VFDFRQCKIFFFFFTVLGPTQPSVKWVPGIKRSERDADHSPPSSAEVEKVGAIPPLPHMSSWHCASVIKHRDNFTIPLPVVRAGK